MFSSSVRSWALILLIYAAGGLLACQNHRSTEKEPEPFEVKVREQGTDFKMPPQLWDLLLAEPGDRKEKAAESGGEGEAKGAEKAAAAASELTTASFLYSPIDVVLKEKNSGVLREPIVRIKLPDGGGQIDLSKWTTGKPGTFFVNFEFDGKGGSENEAKAFFYSRTRKRRVGDQVIGAGCKQFMDLSALLTDPKKVDQLMVNTTRNFHTTVLGGHFLFSWMLDGNRRVTQVTFNDSSNPEFFCESEK